MAKDHPTGQSGLYQAFLQLKTPEQCYRFLQDVCSYSELSAMEQRYNIAEMLVDKRIYTEIMDKTGASSAIISRVSRVLSANDSVLRALLEAEKLPTIKTELPHKPCRVPPVRYAAFIIQPGRQKSPRQRGTSIVFPHAAQMRRLHQKPGRFDFMSKAVVFLPRAPRNVKPCWWSICCAAPRWR